MKSRASFGMKKFPSLKYTSTLFCLRCSFVALSCCFGLIGLSLFYLHNTIGYNQGFPGVDNVLRAYERQSIPSTHSHDHKVENNINSLFGSVMNEFACRVLSRHITSSNILVVAPGAVSAAKEAFDLKSNKQVKVRKSLPKKYSVGGSFLHYGVSEGHAIHAINSHSNDESEIGNPEPTLDSWWRSFDMDKRSNDASKGWWSTEPIEKPNWIILAVFDSGFGSENYIWKEAEYFLEGCTVTYFVIAIHSFKRSDGSYEFGGMDAIDSLLQKKYKLQTLSSSHYHTDVNNEREIFERYGPNALFQSAEEIKGFLRWGADAAQRYGRPKDTYTSYIFATQGLDLAIPTPQHYLRDAGAIIDVFKKDSMKNLPPLKTCPGTDSDKLNFVFNETALSLNLWNKSSVSYSQDELGERSKEEFQLWMDGISLSQSEAVCMKHTNGLSKCKTRVSEKELSNDNTSSGNNLRPNVLLILLDPISRPHFDRSMQKTAATLAELNFIRFGKYTAVGPNSGPNQAALYSGTTLKKRNQLHKNLKSNDKWLWDRLREAGYVTLKAEDSCIENSNMMQSLAPNTTHGSSLQGLFCFDAFSRPNCIGPDLASSILLKYGYQFISTYEKLRKSRKSDLRYASFMHFVDSHEDTMLLSAILDPGLSNFLTKLNREAYFENTVVIVASDHGLHYGPKFGSWQGRKEATEPILFIRMPESLRHKVNIDALHSNAHLWTTPFDLHETLLELTQTSSSKAGSSRRGLTLTEHLPTSRKECRTTSDLIPPAYCNFQANGTQEDNSGGVCRGSLKMPTIDSFFLDLSHINRRPKMNFDVDCHNTKNDLTEISKFDLCNEKKND